jgi:hypothetical protein
MKKQQKQKPAGDKPGLAILTAKVPTELLEKWDAHLQTLDRSRPWTRSDRLRFLISEDQSKAA